MSIEKKAFCSFDFNIDSESKNRAQTELLVRNYRQADPLLASWKYKKGKSIAFTSDVSGRWSRMWVGWRKFAKFWTDLTSLPKDTTKENLLQTPLDLRYKYSGGKLHLYLSAHRNDHTMRLD